jgi:phosphoglycolate/pyridoxal phosphate phosphatase family enzyme
LVSADILSSSFAAALYLKQNPIKANQKVYVVGEKGICDELDAIGIPYIGGPSHASLKPLFSSGSFVQHDNSVGAVVCGLDLSINYFKIQYAQLCLSNSECKFIATNLDSVEHLTDSPQEWAAAGAIVGALKGCSGREPIVVGKPASVLVDYLVGQHGISASRMCMVGDRLDTDMLFGINHSMQTILTLSGVTSLEMLKKQDTVRPLYYVNSIKDFLL